MIRVVTFALALALAACSPSALQIQARLANGVALAANESLVTLVANYRAEGLAAIAAAPDRPAAEAALAGIRARWVPVFGVCSADPVPACRGGAWESLRTAHESWAAALEDQIAGRPLDLAAATAHAQRLRAAYCALRNAAPAARLPDVPGLSCSTDGGAP